MDRIAYAFAARLGNIVRFRSVVSEIRRTENGVRITYSSAADQKVHVLESDYCICTLPIPILADLPADFSNECRQALRGMPMVTQYKIGWQSPRFWEREYNIFGGISFLNQTVDLVWYPSDRLFSSHGVLISGFNLEKDENGAPTPFGQLGSITAKLQASKMAVEKLHPGYSNLLTKPVYVSWPSIPYSLGSFANNHLESSQPAYNQLHQPEGNIFFAGDYVSRIVGWQEGAALSAHHVVAQIADRVRSRRVA
jgi:monoamine oxidase